jgi:hypothetical protein
MPKSTIKSVRRAKRKPLKRKKNAASITNFEKIAVALGIVIAIGGALAGIDSFYARNERVARAEQAIGQTQERLEQFIDFDRLDALERRNWTLEDRYKPKPREQWPSSVLEEYRRNTSEMERIKGKWDHRKK